jgi:hypothetical protein
MNGYSMTDGWDVFIATLDRAALAAERPGSSADRAMRARHASKVNAFWHPPADDALAQVVAEAAQHNRAAGRRRAARQHAATAAGSRTAA